MSHPLARITAGPVDAPTLVLLHGITASALSQTDAIDHWTALGYRVVAVDARGHGLSPRWAPQELERAGEVLIGHSMGAATAMVVAARRPELLTGVVLADPARYGSRSPAELLARGAARERARAAELADPPAAVRRALADAEIPDSEAVVGVWAGQRMDPALLRTGVVAPEAEWAETMAALAVPALLVTGDRPGAARVGPEGLEVVKRIANPYVTTALVPGAAHDVRRSRPDGFYAVVDPWLADHLR